MESTSDKGLQAGEGGRAVHLVWAPGEKHALLGALLRVASKAGLNRAGCLLLLHRRLVVCQLTDASTPGLRLSEAVLIGTFLRYHACLIGPGIA